MSTKKDEIDNWKEYWRGKETDPQNRQETRKDKAAARRRLHKKERKNAKDKLRNFNFEDLD